MPVRIKEGDNSSDPRVISLDMYNEGRDNFTLHYYYTSAEASFGGQVIDIPWDNLQTAVDDYAGQTGTEPVDIALRFVHCFESGPAGHLYLRVQICKMVESAAPPPPGASKVYDLDTTGSLWYEIKNSMIHPTPDETLEGQVYLNEMYYKKEPQDTELQQLVTGPTKFVKNLVMPWGQEILQMYASNGTPENAGVNFAACSYMTSPERANVAWPHGMVIYLSDSAGVPMLDNDDYISLFHNKGADYASLCPPNCNVYILPDIS